MHARDALPPASALTSSPPGLTRWSMLTGRVQLGPISALQSPMDRRVKPGDDEFFCRRDAPSHPNFATPRKAKPRKHSQEASSLKRREAERREAHQPGAASTSDAARALSPVLPLREDRGPRLHQDFIEPWTSKNGAGALAFRRPTAASEVFALGSAQAALPGTTGCKREDPLRHQCSEHLAVRHAPDGTMPKPPASAVYRYARREPLPLRPQEYPREGDVPGLDIASPSCHYGFRH
jgi:hypothetical protein